MRKITISQMIKKLGLHEDQIDYMRESYINQGMHEDSADNMVECDIRMRYESMFGKR